MSENEGLHNAVGELQTLRSLAVKAGNNTLVALTDYACRSRDLVEIEAVKAIYLMEYGENELLTLGVKPY